MAEKYYKTIDRIGLPLLLTSIIYAWGCVNLQDNAISLQYKAKELRSGNPSSYIEKEVQGLNRDSIATSLESKARDINHKVFLSWGYYMNPDIMGTAEANTKSTK